MPIVRRLLFGLLMLVATAPAQAEAGGELRVVFLGLQDMASADRLNARGELEKKAFERLETGERRAIDFISELAARTPAGGATFWSTEERSIGTLLARNPGKVLAPDSIAFSFFTFDDAIVVNESTGDGLTKVAVYLLLSFHVYDFKNRHIVYSRHFILPLEGVSDEPNVDVAAYALQLVSLPKLDEAYRNFLRDLLVRIVDGDDFKKTLARRQAGLHGAFAVFTVEVDNPVNAPAGLGSPLSGSPGYIGYRRLAAYQTAGKLAAQTQVLPAYAGDPSLGIDPSQLTKMVRLHGETVFLRLTGRELRASTGEKSRTDCDSRFCYVDDHPFPEPAWKFKISVKAAMSASRQGDGRVQEVYSARGALAGFDPSGTRACATGKATPTFEFTKNYEYVERRGGNRGEARYYNVIFRALRDGTEKFVVAAPSGEVAIGCK